MSKPADLVQGTLDVLLLKILALEPLHAWAMSQRLKQMSGEVLQVSDSSLYPALHKLEQEDGSLPMESDRAWPAGQVLLLYAARPARLRARSGELGTIIGRHLASGSPE